MKKIVVYITKNSYFRKEITKERVEIKMKKKEVKNKEQKHYDKGQIFVKVMAGFLAVLMVGGTGISLIYALMG